MTKFFVKLFFLLIGILAIFVIWQRTQLAALALTRTDPLPTTYELLAEERYAKASSYLDFFMAFEYVNQNPKAEALLEEISDIRSGWIYQGEKFFEGVIYGSSDEVIGQTSGVASDFIFIGDLRDLTFESIKLAQGEEVDKVLVALAGLGLAASGVQVASGVGAVATSGAATPTVIATSAVKSGLVTLKLARKLGKLPPWIVKKITETYTAYKTSDKLDINSLKEITSNTKLIASTPGGLQLLGKTKSAKELSQMAIFTSKLKEHSLTVYRIGGERAVTLASNVSSKTLALAASFGKSGMRILNNYGPEIFENAASKTRQVKILYKGEIFRLIAMLLTMLPTWALFLCVFTSVSVCMPKKLLSRLTKKLLRSTTKTKSDIAL
ncbi:MAG: hypothetical protein CMG93_07030 [Marinomonas sp.]|nr:hypothetical protein [Marinomonas sp.]